MEDTSLKNLGQRKGTRHGLLVMQIEKKTSFCDCLLLYGAQYGILIHLAFSIYFSFDGVDGRPRNSWRLKYSIFLFLQFCTRTGFRHFFKYDYHEGQSFASNSLWKRYMLYCNRWGHTWKIWNANIASCTKGPVVTTMEGRALRALRAREARARRRRVSWRRTENISRARTSPELAQSIN